MKNLICSALCLGLLAAGCGGAVDSSSDKEDMSVLHFRDAHGGSSTTGGNLIDHGGKVLPVSNTVAIWWGNQSAFPADAQSGIDAMFEGLQGSTFLNVSSQYMRGATSSSSFHTNYTDTSAPPNSSPRVSTIVGEACRVLTANGATPDANTLYLVYTSNFPHQLNYCAFHSFGYCHSTTIQIAYMPNLANVGGCNPLSVADLGCNSYSEGTMALANASSHEFSETITDPLISAWYDNGGSEIGDKCNFSFASCVNLSTGSFQLQQEWSNQVSGCVQQ